MRRQRAGALRVAGAAAGAAAAALALPFAPAAAQEFCAPTSAFKVAPAVIRDDAADWGLGLKASADACRSRHDFSEDFPRSSYLRGALEGQVAFAELRIPHQIAASLGVGFSMSLSKVNTSGGIEDDFYLFHHGFLGLGARGQYEASANLDEQAIAGGAELRYVDPLRWFLPSAVVTWQWVQPVRSEGREMLGVAVASHGRLVLQGYWLIGLGSRVRAEIDGTLFRAYGLEDALEATGWASGEYLAATLEYVTGARIGPVYLGSVFVQYGTGQLPTDAKDRRAWTVGVEVGR